MNVTRDHLGSAAAITDASGNVLVQESFTAFGARRGANWAGSPSSADWTQIANTTRRGFTDHEHLENLIHMNGRVYDPALGRFISADPFIDGWTTTQGYNRYSYVHNNPLRFMDPSGFRKRNPEERNESEGPGGIGWKMDFLRIGQQPMQICVRPGGCGDSRATGDSTGDNQASTIGNLILGVTFGIVGHVIGMPLYWMGILEHKPSINFGNNAIQFHNNPLSFLGAITLGNAINYGPKTPVEDYGRHELPHTIQAEWLGPLYLPLNVIGQTLSLLSFPFFESLRHPMSPAHGVLNFMESGPLSDPPKPWPWR